jgi:hypothetical protein
LLESLPTKEVDSEEADAIDFTVRVIESLKRDVIVSRFRLMCAKGTTRAQSRVLK